MTKYKVVSLFSGAMGLDLGLERSGHYEILACVEKERSFCDTIERNVALGNVAGRPKVICADIANLSVDAFLKATGIQRGEVDLLVGGPPCQSFSTAGKRQSVQDPRGTLLWHFLRFVEELQPRFFLMENVRGLGSAALKHRPLASRPEKGGAPLLPEEEAGSVIRLFAEDLQKMSGGPYHMDCFEVNAVNYGAPQLRERVLYVGNRFNYEVDFPLPTHGNPSAATPDADLLAGTALLPWRTLGEAIRPLREADPVIMDFSPRKKAFLSLIPPGSNWRSLPVDIQQESMGKAWKAKGGRSGWWRKLSYDLPCPTLVTMPNHASTALCHPEKNRALTLREYARVQEFPDEWQFCGTPSQQYAQVGNAVPVRLGSVAGSVIAGALSVLQRRDWRPLDKVLNAYRVIYIQSHVRTRQWFKDGKSVAWMGNDAEGHHHYKAPVTLRRSKELGAVR
ncbi:DNA cytosine methyltransferase [Sphingopyxis sp.]|jgi:DNA (cytosine-5)-methyltransferase 1|uniref:DNA cytosine methyltransferase n=1 Tax=Sphingopyxis sp. TaxID=1908224 RepID=UPI003F70B425